MRQAQITFGTRRTQYYRRRLPFGRATLGSLTRALDMVPRWLDLWQQRQALKLLDERMLRDVGLNKGDVDQELRKPFWQL